MATALDTARYLLWLAESEPEYEPVSQLRLHKLLYYVQGWSLALRNREFFDSDIEAWTHGPVVRAVYPAFADYRATCIPSHEARNTGALSQEDSDFVRWVWEHYKRFSATELRTMTHGETPWIEARDGLGPDQPSSERIRLEAMRDFFQAEYDRQAPPGMTLDAIQRSDEDFANARGVRLAQAKERIIKRLAGNRT